MNSETNNDFASRVADFISRNPRFFELYPHLLEQINLPHPHGTHAVSLSERQLLALREKNLMLETRLKEWLDYGTENDAISKKVHSLAIDLIASKDFSGMLNVTYHHLQKEFDVQHVAMHLCCTSNDYLPDFVTIVGDSQGYANNLETPYCGPTHGLDVGAWFNDGADAILSQALVPLSYQGASMGLLALGSEEADRFSQNMGHTYIERIGHMLAAACMRLGGTTS